jgi:DNA invertase Pin-like site-specific DNA recombinase
VVDSYEDAGISGSNGREKRPGLDRLLKDATARRINMIAAWSVDRLGRSLRHLVELLNELQALHCNLYLHQQAIDTTTPSGKAMFQMCGVFAEFERAMIVERVNSGLARAKAKGVNVWFGLLVVLECALIRKRTVYREGGVDVVPGLSVRDLARGRCLPVVRAEVLRHLFELSASKS